MSGLLSKVKDVITENEALTDQAKAGITRSVFQTVESSESDENDLNDSRSQNILPQKTRLHLEGPNIVFESRISELEAQLAQSNIDLRKISEENESNKRKLGLGFADNGNGEAYKKQIENLQRDKQTLEETVRKLQGTVSQMKDSDAQNFNKTQRNRDIAEQAVFERTQSDLEIRRLKVS